MSFTRKVSCSSLAMWKRACVCRVGGVLCTFTRARLAHLDPPCKRLRSSDTHSQVVLTILKSHKPKILCGATSRHEKLFVCSSAILVCSPCVCCSKGGGYLCIIQIRDKNVCLLLWLLHMLMQSFQFHPGTLCRHVTGTSDTSVEWEKLTRKNGVWVKLLQSLLLAQFLFAAGFLHFQVSAHAPTDRVKMSAGTPP